MIDVKWRHLLYRSNARTRSKIKVYTSLYYENTRTYLPQRRKRNVIKLCQEHRPLTKSSCWMYWFKLKLGQTLLLRLYATLIYNLKQFLPFSSKGFVENNSCRIIKLQIISIYVWRYSGDGVCCWVVLDCVL